MVEMNVEKKVAVLDFVDHDPRSTRVYPGQYTALVARSTTGYNAERFEAERCSMSKAVECSRCHAQMEVGFVVDANQSGYQQQNWSPGEPKPNFWLGLKLAKHQIVPVTTLRCPKCGYLESYAIPQIQNGALVSERSSSQRQLAFVLIGLLALLIAFGVAFLVRAK